MLRSMTGYGIAQAQIEGVLYAIEIRSLNGRHFKANVKLPEIWAYAEADIEKILRERLYRGTVNFILRMRMTDEAAGAEINLPLLQHYVEQARNAIGQQASFDVGTLLQLPGICIPQQADDLCEKSWPALREAVEHSVEQVLVMRRREGQALHTDLMSHLLVVEEQLKVIEPRKDTVVAEYHRRLLSRVNELVNTARLTVNEQDLMREVAVFAERCDISEEISRLRSHLEQFRHVCDHEEQGGRKLDFITQEMLREANTIASKANDAQIARAVVEIKGSIDRIKEQVQNVE